MALYVKSKGQSYRLNTDKLLNVGSEAPDFTYVRNDLSEHCLYDFEKKVKVIMGLPSLDTGVCQMQTRKFNQALEKYEDVVGIVISKDLPFAQKRFCVAEGIENVETGSDYRYGDFAEEFGMEITEGHFKGLTARVVFVIDKKNIIQHVELVPDIALEPNYDAALKVIDKLVNR